MGTNTTTLAAEFAKAGLDWESELRQRAREVALMRELGLEQAADWRPEAGGEARQPDPLEEVEE